MSLAYNVWLQTFEMKFKFSKEFKYQKNFKPSDQSYDSFFEST